MRKQPRRFKGPAIWAALCFLAPCLLPAQDASPAPPLWLRLEEAKQALRDRQLGEAVYIYRDILSRAEKRGETVPEAEMGLGIIFKEEGELELARLQFLSAWEHAGQLYVPDDRYTILYHLADIYSLTYQFREYEKVLLQIIALGTGTENSLNPEIVAYHEAMYLGLLRNGPDRVFVLYRRNLENIQNACSALGLYYYRTGYYRESLRNLIAAAVSTVTVAVEFKRQEVFDYEFTTLSAFILQCRRDPGLAAYLGESRFYENIYYLGAALFALGEVSRARETWDSLASALDFGDPLRDRTLGQLNSPYVEPLLRTRE
ncbi:MAG: hypothetical protein LBQ61_08390 [Spirochaetales bacterium]|jgi:tetratricopeptide (TPR) repeat protein|nr:hypothetical protein [Spirochaetales bacterium]